MSVVVTYPIDPVELAERIAAGWTHIELFYSNTQEGPYVTTTQRALLVATTYSYTITWASGNYAQWFKIRLWNGSTNSDSADSKSFHGNGGTTLAALREETAKHMYKHVKGTTSAAGSTTTAKSNNVRFTRRPDDYYVGQFFHNLVNGEWSEITDNTNTAGVVTFTFSPALTSVGSGVDFEILGVWTPEEYRDAINWSIINNFPKLNQSIVHTGLLALDDTYQYTVPNAIRVVTKVELEALNGLTETTQAKRGHPWREVAFELLDEGLTQKIELKGQIFNSGWTDGRRIRITGTGMLNLLYSDTDYVELVTPQTNLISYLAAHRLYSLLSNSSPASDVDRYRDQANYFMAMYNEHKKNNVSKRKAKRRWQHDARWG